MLDAFEHGVKVDPSMRGPVRVEATRCFLELALAPGSVAPAGMEPRDRDVDEPLQEVALCGRRVAPLFLELFVRLEVLAGPNQLQPSLEPHHLIIRASGATVGPVATILLAGVDLFFRGKLEGLLPDHRLVTTDSVDPPDLVIADISRIDPGEVVDAWPDVPIMGFTNHTDRSGLQRAHAAGFDQVIVKSALVERAPELVAELTGVHLDSTS